MTSSGTPKRNLYITHSNTGGEKLIHYTNYGGRAILRQIRIATEGVHRDARQSVVIQGECTAQTGHYHVTIRYTAHTYLKRFQTLTMGSCRNCLPIHLLFRQKLKKKKLMYYTYEYLHQHVPNPRLGNKESCYVNATSHTTHYIPLLRSHYRDRILNNSTTTQTQ